MIKNVEIEEMYKQYLIRRNKCNELQKKYNFKIPMYILGEMIKDNYDKNELCLLINMARLNNRFTEDEADILKYDYHIK